VAVVTRADLERLGVTSIIEGLRLVPGLDPRARGPHDVQTDFSIRGSTFGQNLVLVDGFRINDAQTGHHNGEIPASVAGIDRIEVVYGAGSAVHGADALGGTINVISRRGPYATLGVEGGQHDYVSAQGGVSGGWLPDGWAINGWGSRSAGFMFDRDFAMGGASVRGDVGSGLSVDVRHQRRAFGANGFYGASPSKEWTDQTMAALAWKRTGPAWVATVRGSVRDHHDHFRWDIARPGYAENLHRTDAGDIEATVERVLAGGAHATFGAAAGTDRVVSSNLGDHVFNERSAFGEIVLPLESRATLQAGLRVDDYTPFGSSLSPSMSAAIAPTANVRLHASASHAFRVPTFTELYYSDPANLGNPDLRAERGWSFDAGADWTRRGWTFSVAPFRRIDRDVIDWVKAAAPDLWRTTNVRDVTTTGVEVSAARRWPRAFLRVSYARLDVDAPSLDLLSKYVLEYATDQATTSISIPIAGGLRAAFNADYRKRLDGQSYALIGARVSRTVRHAELFLDGSNLANETYHEIAGVAMPGRWVTAGVTLR
jgi:iron complex outermembrane receptor protein